MSLQLPASTDIPRILQEPACWRRSPHIASSFIGLNTAGDRSYRNMPCRCQRRSTTSNDCSTITLAISIMCIEANARSRLEPCRLSPNS